MDLGFPMKSFLLIILYQAFCILCSVPSSSTPPQIILVSLQAGLSPEEELHGPGEGLEVDLVVEGAVVADVAEEGHADDGVDEGDEGEEGADVEQRRQRHDQREQQLPDPLRSLHYDGGRREGKWLKRTKLGQS